MAVLERKIQKGVNKHLVTLNQTKRRTREYALSCEKKNVYPCIRYLQTKGRMPWMRPFVWTFVLFCYGIGHDHNGQAQLVRSPSNEAMYAYAGSDRSTCTVLQLVARQWIAVKARLAVLRANGSCLLVVWRFHSQRVFHSDHLNSAAYWQLETPTTNLGLIN